MNAIRRALRGTTVDADAFMAAQPCSELRCPHLTGTDGCWHDPEEPWCAAHLRGCSECRTAIDHDMPPGGAA